MLSPRRRNQRRRQQLNTPISRGRNPRADVRLSFQDERLTPSERRTLRRTRTNRLFSSGAAERAERQNRLVDFQRNRQLSNRLTRRINRADRRGRTPQLRRLIGRLTGVTESEQLSRLDIRDERRAERLGDTQERFFEILGESQRLQEEQGSLLLQEQRQQNRIFQENQRTQTQLQQQLLEEQRAFADLQEQRARRDQLRAAFQTGELQTGVSQQNLIARGRRAAELERRRSAVANVGLSRGF